MAYKVESIELWLRRHPEHARVAEQIIGDARATAHDGLLHWSSDWSFMPEALRLAFYREFVGDRELMTAGVSEAEMSAYMWRFKLVPENFPNAIDGEVVAQGMTYFLFGDLFEGRPDEIILKVDDNHEFFNHDMLRNCRGHIRVTLRVINGVRTLEIEQV